MAERDEESGKKCKELIQSIGGILNPYEMRGPFEEAFRSFLSSEVDASQFLFSIWWGLTERNVLAKVLEEAIERTIDRSVPFTDTVGVNSIDILSDNVNEPEADLPRDLEKTILQILLRSDDGSYISWEDIEEYELILSARARKSLGSKKDG